MADTVHITRSNQHLMQLSVAVQGLTITVTSGDAVFNEVPYTLLDNEQFVVGTYADTAVVTGYVVIVGGVLRIFVDLYLMDGVDAPYEFPHDGLYKPIATLFHFEIPPGTTDLASLDWHRWLIIPE